MTQEYIQNLIGAFELQRNEPIAQQQKAYMKDNFKFIGLKTPIRREIQKPFLDREFLPQKEDALEIVKDLWKFDEREYHYFAQELFLKFKNKLSEDDINLIEYMITHNSWWDTVDTIASNLAGSYFKKFPNKIDSVIDRWSTSEDMWLRRSAIIFQLKYRNDTDKELLADVIMKNTGSKEFFINKAIGWALRSYSSYNAEWVLDFVDDHPELANLSKKEATRNIGLTF